MFDHVTIRVSSRAEAQSFYDVALHALGIDPTHGDATFVEWDDFSLTEATATRAATSGLHVGFVAPSREHVDEFWRVGTEHGYRDAGAPGLRPHYKPDYYGAFLLDPDGNSVELVNHNRPAAG